MTGKNNTKTTIILIVLLFAVAFSIDITVEKTLRARFRAEQQAAVTSSLNEISRAVQGKIEQNLTMISGVAAYLSVDPDLTEDEFRAIGDNIFSMSDMLRSMALTDGFVVKYAYPDKFRSKLIGVDLSTVPGQRALAIRASRQRNMVVDGPIPLVQGRYGIIGRQAIYRNMRCDAIISSVVDINKVIVFVNHVADRKNVKIAFRRASDPALTFGEKSLFSSKNAVIVPVTIMGMSWELAGLPKHGFTNEFPFEGYIHFYTILFILLSLILIFYKHYKVRENTALSTMLEMAQSVGNMGSIVCLSKKQEIIMSREAYGILNSKYRQKLSVEEFLGMLADKDKERVRAALMQSYAKPNTKTEITFLNNSEHIYIKLSAIPMYNIHNEMIGLKGVLSDITAQKKIMNDLAESESRFRDLVLCTSDMVWEMDMDCQYTYFTGKAKEVYGYSETDMLGKTPTFLDETSPNKTSAFFCGTIVKNGLPIKDMERWVKDVNGDERCFLINGVPFFDDEGRLKGYRGVDKDITEQFKLKTEREMIFRVSRDGIAIIDRDSNFKDCNQAYLNMTGYTYEELLATSCRALTPPEDRSKSAAMYEELFKTGYFDKFEKRCTRKDGTIITIQMTLSILPEDRILISARDVTEIIKYQKMVEQSERQLKALFDISPIPMCMLDKFNSPVRINKTFTETFGYNLENVSTLENWWKSAYPDETYRVRVQDGWQKYVEAINAGQEPESVQATVTCADGSKKEIVFLYAPFDGGSIIASYDITSRMEIEKKLQEYIKIVDENVSISRCDTHGFITTVSGAFCKLCGYERQELIGKNHEAMHHPDNAETAKSLEHQLEAGGSWHGELHKIGKDGVEFWTETMIYPMFNDQGEKFGYMGIDQDITDKKHIEKMSITDKLTAIYNRIKLDEVLHTEFVRYERSKTPFSVILFDIDFFKRVNDTYGHLVGDEVLKALAHLVGTSVRENDTFGRWGGEEFLIICSGTEVAGAVTLAEKLRRKIELYEFPEVENLTCSFGVAEITDDGTDNMVKNADDALYRAKQSGRNKVEPHA